MITDAERAAVLAEYNALRSELLALMQARNQFLIFDLTSFGVLFGIALDQIDRTFLLVAPLIHYPLMMHWSYANRQIIRIGLYIKDKIEPNVVGIRWETAMFSYRCKSREEPLFPALKKYVPTWNLRKFTQNELSGLVAFAGSTALALLLWASEVSLPGRSQTVNANQVVDVNQTINIYTTIFLFALDIGVILLTYHLVHQNRKDFDVYCKSIPGLIKGGHLVS